MTSQIVVVKLGGSLLAQARLDVVLGEIPADRGVVLVPGGGMFADAVRVAQVQAGFDDALAHRLALDAMGTMAQVMRALRPDLVIERSPAALAGAALSGRLAVWDPADLRAGNDDIPETWDVTSDSLGAWLARALDASSLVVVKCAEMSDPGDPSILAEQGIVDRGFCHFVSGFDGGFLACTPDELFHILDAAPVIGPNRRVTAA